MVLMIFMEEAMKNVVAKDLHTPKYKMRVVRNKTKYRRQPKHKGVQNV
jgi:hypothetical protein